MEDQKFSHKKIRVVYKQIENLKGVDYNPRKLSKGQYGEIKDSLLSLDMIVPIVVNMHPKRKNYIVGGHQRVAVALDLGMKEIPCIEVNYPEKKEKEAVIRLNKASGEWDWDKMGDFFDEKDLKEWGFGEGDLWPDEKTVKFKVKKKKHECPECGHKF